MDSQALPLVSIVTPVHNEARHLADCVESVLAQTYQNWDYTIVDNCSTDGSLEIARQYAARDARIRVLENSQFLPALANFNHALRQISCASKYCKVVLGDDWIFPECLERMVAIAEEHSSAGIVSAYALEGNKVICVGLPAESTFASGREICRKHFLEELYVFGSPTTLLYRADLVRSHDPFYNEANIHADNEACFVLLKTSDFAFVHQVLTFSRVRPDSRSAADTTSQTDLGAFLEILLRHGPACLIPDELNARLARLLSDYYRFLGKSLILGRDKMFWGYHKTKLTESGVGFSHIRLARGMLATAIDAGLNPKNSIEKLLKRRNHQNRTRTPESAPVTTSGMEDWAASGGHTRHP
ncbi:MAG: glycosyltransferase family 2 protein [Terriglobia bacterium]